MKKNALSANLKSYQNLRNLTLSEFAAELDIPKTTLHDILNNGNATLATAIHISHALDITLDKLIHDETMPNKLFILKQIEITASWLSTFPPDKRRQIASLLSQIWRVISE